MHILLNFSILSGDNLCVGNLKTFRLNQFDCVSVSASNTFIVLIFIRQVDFYAELHSQSEIEKIMQECVGLVSSIFAMEI